MKIIVLVLTFTTVVYAQIETNKLNTNEDPMLYFPHNEGDVWEYYDIDDFIVDTIRATMRLDSTDLSGNIYVAIKYVSLRLGTYMYTDFYKLDTSNNVWRGYVFLQYKLDARFGDQWVAFTYGSGGNQSYEIMRVVKEDEGSIFGITTKFKSYLNYYSIDSTDTIGLSRFGATLAKGFGMVTYSTGFTSYFLRGCIINGIRYGTVTSIIDLSENNPNEFILNQNFPNPFNLSTTISYKVNKLQSISLIVYDLWGREVIKLIDNEPHASGDYKKNWDCKNSRNEIVVSGIYFYRLIGEKNAKTHSMVLIK